MKLIKLIPALFLFSSCGGNSSSDIKSPEEDSSEIADTSVTMIKEPGTAYEVVNAKGFYVWDVDVEKKTLKKNPQLSDANINADSVISGLNQQYENILLEKININKETINLKIASSDYLTNQIGSSGAAQYIAQTVLNLTSVPGIRYVHIDFTEGSHAAPGTWSKKDFPGYIVVH